VKSGEGDHAIGVHNSPGSTELWTELCELWLKEMGFLNSIKMQSSI